jgi:putative hydrolase of the HAD superfamily
MTKNIIFDIGKVLIGFEWEDFILSLFDKEKAMIITNALWMTGYWHELDRAVLSEDEILEMFYGEAPEYKADIRECYDRVGECITRRDWVIPLVEKLKSQGYGVYFLSNLSVHVLESNPDAFDFVDHMDGGIFSCFVKCIKPDREIYCKLFDKYELNPEECLFIDDHEENIETGNQLGMPGIVFHDREQMLADLKEATGCKL